MAAAVALARTEPSADPKLLLECLEARAQARARLWSVCEIEFLHDAVDELWSWADRWGLVAHFGIDAIQSVLAHAFAPFRSDLGSAA